MTLGCATSYSAAILTRGGGSTLTSLDCSRIEWSRSNNSTSTATATIDGASGPAGSGCCGALASINPWQHELSISRNGQQVWLGPVTEVDYNRDSVVIQAADLGAWLDRRRMTHRLDRVSVLPEQYARHVVEQAILHDNSMNLSINVWSASVGGGITRAVKFRDFRMCSSEMSDLAATWIDWWVVLRTIYLAGFEWVGPEASVTDDHFLEVDGVKVTGDLTANNWVITGRGRGSRGVEKYGQGENDSSLLGLHMRVEADDNLHKEEDLVDKAERLAYKYNGVSTSFSGGRLDESFPLSVNDIHPGVVLDTDLSTTCRPVTGNHRVVGVNVSVDAEGEDFRLEVERQGRDDDGGGGGGGT